MNSRAARVVDRGADDRSIEIAAAVEAHRGIGGVNHRDRGGAAVQLDAPGSGILDLKSRGVVVLNGEAGGGINGSIDVRDRTTGEIDRGRLTRTHDVEDDVAL